jgi:preprotein translocase YajC subunit
MSQDINSLPMKSSNNGNLIQIGIMFVVFLGFILWQNYTNKKHENEKKSMLNDLKIGDKVQTNTGIIGIISFISEDKQIIEIKTGFDFSTKISININSIYSINK